MKHTLVQVPRLTPVRDPSKSTFALRGREGVLKKQTETNISETQILATVNNKTPTVPDPVNNKPDDNNKQKQTTCY